MIEKYILSEDAMKRTSAVVRRGESALFGDPKYTGRQSASANVEVLQIQAGAANAFGYPARIQQWSDTAGTWSDLSTTEVRVEDPNGGVFAEGAYVPHARFVGINSSNVGCFSAKVATFARFVRFALPSALATTDASKAACTVDDYWGGTSPGATVTVYNLPASTDYMFSGLTGNKGVAVYDEIDSKWWIIQLQCSGSGSASSIAINATTVLGGDTNGLIHTDGSVAQTAANTRIATESLELKLGTNRWVAFSVGSY